MVRSGAWIGARGEWWRPSGGPAAAQGTAGDGVGGGEGVSPAPEPVERGVVGSDVLEPAAPSAPSPAALPASPCTAWMESD